MELSGGAVVGPGLATFYSTTSSGSGFPGAVKAFYDAIKAALPPDLTVTVPSTGDSIDSLTGDLVGAWSGTGGGSVVGTGSGQYALGVGLRIRWDTAGIVAGRRVRGSTFIVPVMSSTFTGSGALDDTVRGTFATAAGTLAASVPAALTIWSRPTATRAGAISQVTSASVPDKVAWLRSRRT